MRIRIASIGFALGFFFAGLLAYGVSITKAEYFLPTNRAYTMGCDPNGALTMYMYSDVVSDGINLTEYVGTARSGTQNCKHWVQVTDQKLWSDATTTQIQIAYSINVTSGSCQIGYTLGTTTPIDAIHDVSNGKTSGNNTASTTWTGFALGANALYAGLWVGIVPRSSQTCVGEFKILGITTTEGQSLLDIQDTATLGGGDTIIMVSDILGNMTTEWTCETVTGVTTCEATATTSVSLYNGPSYHEWLYIAGVIIFLLSYLIWKRMSVIPS